MIHLMNIESSKSLKLFPRSTIWQSSFKRMTVSMKPPIGTTTLLHSVSIVVHIVLPPVPPPVKLAGCWVMKSDTRPPPEPEPVVWSKVSVRRSEMPSNWLVIPSLNRSLHQSSKASIASLNDIPTAAEQYFRAAKHNFRTAKQYFRTDKNHCSGSNYHFSATFSTFFSTFSALFRHFLPLFCHFLPILAGF